LDAVEFDCPRCEAPVPYKDGYSHPSRCLTDVERCPARCGVTGLKSVEELEDHLLGCRNLIRRCACCPVAGHLIVLRDEDCPCPAKLASKVDEVQSEEIY